MVQIITAICFKKSVTYNVWDEATYIEIRCVVHTLLSSPRPSVLSAARILSYISIFNYSPLILRRKLSLMQGMSNVL